MNMQLREVSWSYFWMFLADNMQDPNQTFADFLLVLDLFTDFCKKALFTHFCFEAEIKIADKHQNIAMSNSPLIKNYRNKIGVT